MEILSLFWSTNQLYVIYLLSVLICAEIIKEYNLFGPFYYWLQKHVKCKKALVGLISCFSGVLPIPGRCVVSAALLDSIAKQSHRRGVFGIVDYLCTHHYYFWSPLEKTVILPMAAFGLTYLEFIGFIWPLLAVYLLGTVVYLLFFVREEDISITIETTRGGSFLPILPMVISIGFLCVGYPPYIVFGLCAIVYWCISNSDLRIILSKINWQLVVLIIFLLAGSQYIKTELSPLVEDFINGQTLVVACGVGTGLAFLMGSSSKFAGIVVILCSIFGIQYLPLFFAFEFVGYLVSPTHKCLLISKQYFGTNLVEFYIPLILVSISICVTGIVLVL